MSKSCKTCRTKKAYEKLKTEHESQKNILNAIENQNKNLIKDIKKEFGLDTKEPVSEVIEYVKNLQDATKEKNVSTSIIMRLLLWIALIGVIAMLICYVGLLCITYNYKNIIGILLSLVIFITIIFLIKNEPKEEVNIYNFVMGVCTMLSLFLSMLSIAQGMQ